MSCTRILPLCLTFLASCAQVRDLLPQPDAGGVVYALGGLEGFTSPLGRALKPACPALEFPEGSHTLSKEHTATLAHFITDQGDALETQRLLIVGHTPVDLPGSYARALSERRAQAVRQLLIENGMNAANVQTLGLGHDSPAGSTGHRVIIYQQ